MKRKIRYNAFETNSSSTHAICISKKDKSLPPDESTYKQYYEDPLVFQLNKFGWEFSVLKTPEEKASYLYTAIFSFYEDRGPLKKVLYNLSKILNKYNIRYVFTVSKDQLKNLKWFFKDCNISYKTIVLEGNSRYYSIDELWGFTSSMLTIIENEYELLAYLFGDSFVVTGNDNDEDFENYLCKPGYEEFNHEELHNNWKDELVDGYDICYKGN